VSTSMAPPYKSLWVWVKHFFGYLVFEIFLCPESWRGSLYMYLLSFPRFLTLSIERFWFLFWSILNGMTLKTSNSEWFSQWRHQIAKSTKRGFCEFLFTLGWRQIENKSLYKFPAPRHVSFRKHSNLNFEVFRVRDTKIAMLSHWKKSLPLIFSRFTISSIKRCVYAHVC